MWSTRARLAATYAGLLFATLVVFCVAVYIARRAGSDAELGERRQELGERAEFAADQILTVMARAERSGRRLTARDSTKQLPVGPDGVRDSVWVVAVSPLPELRNTLDSRSGYFMVLDERSRLLYSSRALRQLPEADRDSVNRIAVSLDPGRVAAVLPTTRG